MIVVIQINGHTCVHSQDVKKVFLPAIVLNHICVLIQVKNHTSVHLRIVIKVLKLQVIF